MKAKIGKSYLTEIPHEGGFISFQHPAFRGNYGSVAEQIDKEGVLRPNSPQTASLVYDAFQNPEGKYEQEIIDILNNKWFIEFTGNLYLPKNLGAKVHDGVIIEHNPEIKNGRLAMNKRNLIMQLNKNDPNVKFVPFGFKVGVQTTKELERNAYIVARYGEEGASKIAKVASKYKSNPKLWSFESVNEEIQRMSALDGGWGFGDGLCVVGDDWLGNDDGHAFGVCAPEKSE